MPQKEGDKKTKPITFRVEKKVKEKLLKIAELERRTLADYLRLLTTDIVEGKIIVSYYNESIKDHRNNPKI